MSHTDTAPNAIGQSFDLSPYEQSLSRMSDQVARNQDPVLAEKFEELSEKLKSGRLTVAFCGHFSAGKSTLVNTLCGAELLPASPIPTSANVVTVVNGVPSAETIFRGADGKVHPLHRIPVEQLHSYAVDGEGVTSIQVSFPIPLLGDKMAIVDTPGVDSTDGAHRAATESALHLADVVFYVTDYNHVQSEVNFRFLRSMARWGKPTYLIVNQIDKHREEQIAFRAFQDSLSQALGNWDIQPAGTIFLSLRQPDHPLSQWNTFLRLIKDLQPLAMPLMLRSAERSARHLAEQYREALHERNGDARANLLEQMGEDGEADQRRARRLELESCLAEIESAGDRRRQRVRVELDKLLGNANLTPAETREKVREALEAMQSGFKVGWLSSAAKTETERVARLEKLADDFNRQVSAHVTGHLKELLRKEADSSGLQGEALEQSLSACFGLVTADWLRGQVKPGAGADGQATLHYSAEISAELKSDYRKAANRWVEELQLGNAEELEAQAVVVRSQLDELRQRDQIAEELEGLEASERAEEPRLLGLLPARGSGITDMELPEPAKVSAESVETFANRGSEQDHEVNSTSGHEQIASMTVDAQVAEAAESADQSQPGRLGAPQGAAEKLERSVELLTRIPALRTVADSLRAKAERFKNKSFTIALFGAFSAGKSSFANALVGKSVLPVSPNPTTATINRIVAPTGDQVDGTALITMKTSESFAEDVRHSLKRIGVANEKLTAAGSDIPRLLALKDPISSADLHPRGRPHLAFLTAAALGWGEYGALLGQRLTVSDAEYRRYAAEERASCFVAEIDLYVDSPITRSGAVLVDTPGADSINARHTGVAFQYIKNADAVLFVTYYNHAFTEADREFLNQLGNVKDVFELDKMFFIINAADLASSEAELDAVREHVSKQLLKHGIRKPRLFSVSSLLGLEAKQAKNPQRLQASGITGFESAFRSFSEEELGGLALASANKELDRVGKLLDGFLQSATEDAATREAKAHRLQEQARAWSDEGSRSIPATAVQPLTQEIEEQLYHLRQRLKFRFKEHFQGAFHPSVLQDDGRDLKKLIAACGEDLKRSLGEDLLQELRSAGLRLEGTVHRMAEEALGGLSGITEMQAEGFSPEAFERTQLELPLPEPFAHGPVFELKLLWNAFRSPKHFYEKEGATALREELNERLFHALDEELDPLRSRWNETAAATLHRTVRTAALAWSEQLAAFALSMSQSLLEPGEERMLTEIREQWRIISQ